MCFLTFMVQKNSQTTIRVIKPHLEMFQTPRKALPDKCVWAGNVSEYDPQTADQCHSLHHFVTVLNTESISSSDHHLLETPEEEDGNNQINDNMKNVLLIKKGEGENMERTY